MPRGTIAITGAEGAASVRDGEVDPASGLATLCIGGMSIATVSTATDASVQGVVE